MRLRGRKRSHVRTVFLGICAMAVLLWAAVYRFNIPADILMAYFQGTLLVLAAVVGLSALAALVWVGLRRIRRGRRRDS